MGKKKDRKKIQKELKRKSLKLAELRQKTARMAFTTTISIQNRSESIIMMVKEANKMFDEALVDWMTDLNMDEINQIGTCENATELNYQMICDAAVDMVNFIAVNADTMKEARNRMTEIENNIAYMETALFMGDLNFYKTILKKQFMRLDEPLRLGIVTFIDNYDNF